uniref:RecF/RecN/SMC N-terminal domain-containing protein n=1 Tax=Arcella intermedia TaxID=1963864 RepID=A0A6B2LLV7_9EUKA
MSICLQQRRKYWNVLLQAASRKTKSNFNVYLSQKGHSGELLFDHEKKTLNISVKLSNSNNTEGNESTADTMSGGERSYSTVSLLLSLWGVMELPFYAMDEFDVFMDAVNRHVSIDLLVATGLRNLNKQYIFITPHNSASIPAGKYVKVHKMYPPRKQS